MEVQEKQKQAGAEKQENKNQKIIHATVDYVRQKLEGESSGHDWWHVCRVWQLAKTLAQHEGADLFVVELAALLHDIADWKFHGGDESVGPRVAGQWLQKLLVDQAIIEHVCQIIKDISFKGAGVATPMKSKEGMVVQDADRIDAIGAVGVARCFAFGGHKGQLMHDPDAKVAMHKTAQEYKTVRSTSVNHFYEKLLLLKDRMNTDSARQIAQKRHDFMKRFLGQFLSEWAGQL